MRQGRFVSFEGIEGCGKTTQIDRLAKRWTAEGSSVLITREPGGTAVGEGIRRILLDSQTIHLTPEAELLLFYASRSQNIEEKIKPALARGEIVLCDRFSDASLAYQGYGRGLSLELIQRLTDLVCREYRPDVTMLLDIDPATGLERARRRNDSQAEDEGRFEGEDLDFYRRVRDGYLELAVRSPDRIRVVSGEGTVEEVEERIWSVLVAVTSE
jgi:dTMP kinase